MGYIGNFPTALPLTSSDLPDDIVTSAKIADGTITATDTDGSIGKPAFKNLIINGDMSIAQRGTSTSSVSGNGYFASDRFKNIIGSLGTWTVSQSTDVPTGQGFATSLKMDCTTADASPSASDNNMVAQIIEGQNAQLLKKGTSNAESVTLSFWVKSNKTGTYICELYDVDNTRQISQAYTISSSNTWEKKTLSYVGDTTGTLDNDNGASLQLNFFLATGSDRSSGTLSTTWTSVTNANRAVGQVNLADSTSNEWYVTGVQLEVGEFDSTTIPSFPFESYASNLQKCKRYFQYSVMGYYGDTSGGGYGGAATFAVEHRATPSYLSAYSSIIEANNRFNTTVIANANNLSQYGLLAQKAQSASNDSGYYFAKMATDAEL